MSLICLDIGNTRMKVGIFHADKAPDFLVFKAYDVNTFKALQDQYSGYRFVLSSTARLTEEQEQYLLKTKDFFAVSHNTQLPFDNLYGTPATLGIDRIALIAGAKSLYPGRNCLVIDTGTCITLDFINDKGAYLGGSIHPGIEMRLKALHNFTGKLPLVDSAWQDGLIGNTTTECIKIGAITGAVKEIEHFILEYQEMYSDIVVILTGGDSEVFFYKVKNEIFAHPNLVLTGLEKIARYNAK